MVKKNTSLDILERTRIRFNNIFALFLFNILELFYYRNKNSNDRTILFINTGLLGDVLISTIIFANEKSLKNIYQEIYFLLDNKFEEIFKDYSGKINIIYWKQEKYKYNLFYRIKFLNKLNHLNINESINITFARRIIDDEISLLNGAREKICFKNNPKIIKSFSKYFDSFYNLVLQPQNGNHFNDLIDLLKKSGISNPEIGTKIFIREILPNVINNDDKDYIKGKIFSLAPFSSRTIKDWEWEKYVELIGLLVNEYNPTIFILGDKNRPDYLEKVSQLESKVINTIGLTTLSEVSYLISVSDMFIGNDSGLFHLAKAYNKNRICIVGGGALNITLPYYNNDKEILMYKEMECFKCHWRCKYNYSYCIQDVTAVEVMKSVKRIFK